ncbi:hypothetical protein Taro_005913 [Colocasia esculenta]|uniref:Cell division control protein n=1 Tax=Colocasia esculenta TaxID=4460 RepID=A0A843TMA4_COLES|nr:hypothetical protein [Colocasia esculenta]
MAKSPAKRRCRKAMVPEEPVVDAVNAEVVRVQPDATPPSRKRRRDRGSTPVSPASPRSPVKSATPPRRANGGADANGASKMANSVVTCCSPKSPRKRLFANSPQMPKWNPEDPRQIKAAKEAFHVSTAPATLLCRGEEQMRILEFCKTCIEQDRAGSLYVCGCPGTGKTLSMGRVKEFLTAWTKDVDFQSPDVLNINCTSLTVTSEIFSKILEKCHSRKINGASSPLQKLQNLFSQKKQPSCIRTTLVIVDEMDYLITKDRAVLHDLFMLTTYPFSKIILMGIANAIDLADRFLPRLESLNCKPMVVTFCAYTKDQILTILQQRLMVLGYDVFEPLALEFCARVNFDHMDAALSKAFKSPVVDTIQALPQHQQIILCALVKLLGGRKSSTTMGDLNKMYSDICRSVQFPAACTTEFSNMCKVLSDQGLLKLGQSREEKLRRVVLAINCTDVTFSLKFCDLINI